MKRNTLLFLFTALVVSSCSTEERVINNFRDSWEMLVASNSPSPSVKRIGQPGTSVLSQDILTDSMTVAGRAIKKLYAFRDQIYMFSRDSNRLVILAAADFSHRATLDFGDKSLSDMCFANGTTAYICHENTNSVSVLDVLNNKIANQITISTGKSPVSIAALGNQVYVANRDDNSLSVIDTRTNELSATIPVAPVPSYIRPDSVGQQMVVVSLGTGKISAEEEKSAAKLSLINVATRQLLSQITLYETVKDSLTPLPAGLAVTGRQFAFIPLQKSVMSVDVKRRGSLRKASDGTFNDIFFNGLRQELLYIQNTGNSAKVVVADPASGQQRSNFTLPFPVQALLPL